jgi:hypothetical protein
MAYRERNPEVHRTGTRKWALEHPLETSAHKKVQYALRIGRLVRPAICSQCGQPPKRGVVHAHHPDYTKPLEVVWLCAGCHEAT